MAEVYVARQAGMHGLHKTVVLKRVRPEMMDGETLASFLDEARLVAELEHTNIAQVYEVGEIDESYFIVMEYVNGADLRQLMQCAISKGIRVSLGDALFIIASICAALHYAHERCDLDGQPLSIVHRDVSPSNVLVSHDGAIKVCDFGIAKARNRSTETVRGTIKGKFAYMSPEQCRCEPLDRRSDIFSIGILLYELTTLSRAFSGSTDFDLLRAVIEQPVQPPTKRIPDYPPELERIVMCALDKDPHKRYQAAQDMQRDLEAFAREHKLAMSAINVAALMDMLFDRRIDAWRRGESDDLPEIVIGTEPGAEIAIDDAATIHRPAPQMSRWAHARWLATALAGVGIACAATIAELATAPAPPDPTIFDADARAISAALDTTADAIQLRVDGVASAPVLRAAIETDAATIADLVHDEKLIAPAQHEIIEIFQRRDGQTSSVLRVPRDAHAIEPRGDRKTRIETDGTQLFVTVGAPIAGQHPGIGGTLAISVPVDLAPIQRQLDGRVAAASIAGLGPELRLIGSRTPLLGAPLRVSIPRDDSPSLALVVETVPTARAQWAGWVRFASLAMALAALAAYVLARIRARESAPA